MSLKQDRIGTRNSEDLRRRLNVKSIDEASEKVDASVEEVNRLHNEVVGLNNSLTNTRESYVSTNSQMFTSEQKARARENIGAGNSSFSGSYNDLTDKPTIPTNTSDLNNDSGYVEDTDYVHTDNNYTTPERNKLSDIESGAQTNIIEIIKVNGVTQSVSNKTVNITVSSSSNSYDLSSYKTSSVTMLRSSCIVKDNRVCINCVCSISMSANATTTLFNLPSEIRPTGTKDFVAYGQIDNNNGSLGYGYITSDGLLQVRFENAVSSYIRFNCVYDLD